MFVHFLKQISTLALFFIGYYRICSIIMGKPKGIHQSMRFIESLQKSELFGKSQLIENKITQRSIL